MWKNFNSKIFAVAIIPFAFYVVISIYIFIQSEFQWSVFQPAAVFTLSIGTFVSALCYSMKDRRLHYLATLIMCILGAIGIYIGITSRPILWMELLTSSCLIAFGFAMLGFLNQRNGNHYE